MNSGAPGITGQFMKNQNHPSPANTYELISKIERFSREWSLKNGTQPGIEETLKELDVLLKVKPLNVQ